MKWMNCCCNRIRMLPWNQFSLELVNNRNLCRIRIWPNKIIKFMHLYVCRLLLCYCNPIKIWKSHRPQFQIQISKIGKNLHKADNDSNQQNLKFNSFWPLHWDPPRRSKREKRNCKNARKKRTPQWNLRFVFIYVFIMGHQIYNCIEYLCNLYS